MLENSVEPQAKIDNLTEQEIKGAVVGMTLGDCHLEFNKGATLLRMEHKGDKLDYVAWKAKILENLVTVRYGMHHYDNGKGFVQGPYDTAGLCTKHHPLLEKVRLRTYYQGRKTVDPYLIRCLNPLGLAIWFMDDGSLKYKHSNMILRETSLKSWEVVFATHCFSQAENIVLAKTMYRHMGLIMRLQRQNQYWFLALAAKSQILFWSLVAPYMVQVGSMHYKLPPAILGQYRAVAVKPGVETMYQPPVVITG